MHLKTDLIPSNIFQKHLKKYSNYKEITDKEQKEILDHLSIIIEIKAKIQNCLHHRKPATGIYVKKMELKRQRLYS